MARRPDRQPSSARGRRRPDSEADVQDDAAPKSDGRSARNGRGRSGGTKAQGPKAGAVTAEEHDPAAGVEAGATPGAGAGTGTGANTVERPQPAGWRARILPRSLLGVSSLILAFAVGAGFSGVVLYAYYQYHLNQTNSRVNALVSGYKKQFANAEGDLAATAAAAKATIQSQLQAVQQVQSDPATLAKLVKKLAPSLYFVHTLDASGQPSVGTAFVISSNATQSLLLTSDTTVGAATHSPGPAVYVRHGNTDTQVSVQTWDPAHDLALLVLPQGNLPAVAVAPTSPSPQPGERVFAVSGLGSAGASLTQGTVVDVFASGVAEDAAIGAAFQGGPVVDQGGQVVAVASRSYSPLGFNSSGVWYAPFVNAACSKVLQCPGGALPGS